MPCLSITIIYIPLKHLYTKLIKVKMNSFPKQHKYLCRETIQAVVINSQEMMEVSDS